MEYTWDHRNRLTRQAVKHTTNVFRQTDFAYDPLDRRIRKTADADGAGAGTAVTNEYIYDGDNLYLQFDTDSGIGFSDTLTHRYLHGPAIDQALMDETFSGNGLSMWVLGDHQHSTRVTYSVDPAFGLLNRKEYDSFGRVIDEYDPQPIVDTIFGYTGREFDDETTLQYNRARYYDPDAGRFLSQDPSGIELSGDYNLYRYAGNNPLNATDPTGLATRYLGQAASAAGAGLGSALGVYSSLTAGLSNAAASGIAGGLGSLSQSAARSTVNVAAMRAELRSLQSQLSGNPSRERQLRSQIAEATRPPQLEPRGSLRSQLFAGIDTWSNIDTGNSWIDVPGSFAGSVYGNVIAKPLAWLGTHWREDTREERIETILTRQRVVNQSPQMSAWTAGINLYASATTDNIAYGAVGYDPIGNRSLSGGERAQMVAGGTSAYIGSLIPAVRGTNVLAKASTIFRASTPRPSFYNVIGNGLDLTDPALARSMANTGPVHFNLPRTGATTAEIAQMHRYVEGANQALLEGGLSPTGRVSTVGTRRRLAAAEAAAERAAAVAEGRPYGILQVGHVPDTTWTGNPQPFRWMGLTERVNTSLGAQAGQYPIGYRPTGFYFGE